MNILFRWLCLFGLVFHAFIGLAQNGIIGSGFTNGWTNPNDIIGFDAGAGDSRIKVLQPNGTGDQFFRIVRNWSGDNSEASPSSSCANGDNLDITNLTGSEFSGANNNFYWNCTEGAYYINVANTDHKYVFKTRNGHSSSSFTVFQLETNSTQNPTQITQLTFNGTSTPESSERAYPGEDIMVKVKLDQNLITGEAVMLRYTTNSFSSSTAVQMTCSGTECTATIPGSSLTEGTTIELYAFTTGSEPTNISAITSNPNGESDFRTINANGDGTHEYTISAAASTGSEGACSDISFSTPINGTVEGHYNHLTEYPFAAPHPAPSNDMSATDNSDFIGEGANNRYEKLGTDPYSGDPDGSTDIKQFRIFYDDTNLYLVVEGPSAYDEKDRHYDIDRDVMDLFIAIDTDNNTGPTVTMAHTEAPKGKRVDFAGWDPEYFVVVDGANEAGLYAAGSSMTSVTDNNNNDETKNAGFQTKINGDKLEVQIPWSAIGGMPPPNTGKPFNFAIYTTFGEDGFDAYDTGPGIGNASVFEQVGDGATDTDHCGIEVDPVTGMNDPGCNSSPDNTDHGAGNSPGSDNSDKDFDTIEEYYAVTNVGQQCCSADAGDLATSNTPADFVICEGEDLVDDFENSTTFNIDYSAGDETDPGIALYESTIILADASGNILAHSTAGDFDFSMLAAGTYSLYSFNYATFNSPNTIADYLTALSPNTIAQIQADDDDNSSGGAGNGTFCLDLNNLNASGNPVEVTINPLPVAVDPNIGVCDGDSTIVNLDDYMDAVKDGETGIVSWFVDNPANVGNTALTNTEFDLASDGDLWAVFVSSSGCSDTVDVSTSISGIMAADATISECDADRDGVGVSFDLTDADDAVKNGNTAATVTYYETIADAIAEMGDITTITNTSVNQVVYARVEDGTGMCYDISEVTLRTILDGCPASGFPWDESN